MRDQDIYAVQLRDRYDALKGARSNWERSWAEIIDYVIPHRGPVYRPSEVDGEQRVLQIYDSTAVEGLKIAAAGMFAFTCPPSQPWFSLLAVDRRVRSSPALSKWYGEVAEEIRTALLESNFYQQVHEAFLDLESVGTGCLYSEEDPEKGNGHLVFNSHGVSEYVIDANYEGFIDTVFRYVEFTARQAVQKFGEDALGDEIREALKDPKRPNRRFEFLHFVGPNEEFDKARKDSRGKRFRSVWIDYKYKYIVREGGYEEMPYHVCRLDKSSGELYGRSSASRVLPTIKLVNAQQRTLLKAGQKAVDPPVLLPSDGSVSSWRNDAGAINYWNGANRDAKPESWRFEGQLQIGIEMIRDNQSVIMEAFNAHLFNALALAPTKGMTATEVHERVDEKLTLLAPLIARLQSELFTSVIGRVYNILDRAGRLPDRPVEADRPEDFQVAYLGKLAQALRQTNVNGLLASLQAMSPFFEGHPEILDNIDMDEAILEIMRANSVPEKLIRSAASKLMLRTARLEQERARMELEAADTGSKALQRTAKRPEDGSPAQMAMQQ